MTSDNFTPLEIEYHEETGGSPGNKIKRYVSQNKSLVLTIGAFTLITIISATAVIFTNIKETQDIARAKAIEEQNIQLVSAKAEESKTIITPTQKLSVTRPPTRTPTPTKTIMPTSTITNTPTITSTPTHTLTPTLLATMTLTPTITPTVTLTPTITSTPTITLTPTLTTIPTSAPTDTPTETPVPTPT